MANLLDSVFESVDRVLRQRAPTAAEAAYEAALKRGVLEPGKKKTFLIGKIENIPGNRRQATKEEAVQYLQKSGRLKDRDQIEALYDKSFEDPNWYVARLKPESYFESVYGPAWRKDVRPRAMTSLSRPEGALAEYPSMANMNPRAIDEGLKTDLHVFRGPGLLYAKETGNPPRLKFSGGFYNQNIGVFAPRALHDIFGVGDHEMRHALFQAIGDPRDWHQALLKSNSKLGPYNRQLDEMMVHLGMLKAGHFMRSGQVIGGQGDARRFLEDVLLKEQPKKSDPDPIAAFGPRKGQPIRGHTFTSSMIRDALLNAPEDQDRAVALLPKVFGVAAPVAAGAAASGGDR